MPGRGRTVHASASLALPAIVVGASPPFLVDGHGGRRPGFIVVLLPAARVAHLRFHSSDIQVAQARLPMPDRAAGR